MASTSIQKLFEHGKRAQTALQNMRKREKEATNDLVLRFGTAGSVILGGVIAGGIDGKWGHDGTPTSEKYGIAAIGPAPINLVGGAVLVAAGLSGVLPGSEYITGLGASMASFSIGKFVENKIVEKSAK
jgi:hypothetical protein